MILDLFHSRRGFTLVELIVIIVVLGILSTVVAPRFFDLDGFQERGSYDEVVAAVRYGQKVAVASGCEVQVRINDGADAYGLYQRDAGCSSGAFTRALAQPAGAGAYRLPLAEWPAGISLSAAVITFDALGRAGGAASVGVGGRTFSVVGETGYVDAP